MEGLKRKDVRPCACCRQGLLEGGKVVATRMRVTRLGADLAAIRRRMGLEMMLNPMLAEAMGPDDELLKAVGREEVLLICDDCALKTTVAELWEKVQPA